MFNYPGYTLADAINGLKTYDDGFTDAGIKDDVLKNAVYEYLVGLSEDDARLELSRHIREQYLTESRLAAGYGVEDVKSFIEWLDRELDYSI